MNKLIDSSTDVPHTECALTQWTRKEASGFVSLGPIFFLPFALLAGDVSSYDMVAKTGRAEIEVVVSTDAGGRRASLEILPDLLAIRIQARQGETIGFLLSAHAARWTMSPVAKRPREDGVLRKSNVVH